MKEGHYDEDSLEETIDIQKKVTEHLQSRKASKKSFSIAIIVDDLQIHPTLAESLNFYMLYSHEGVIRRFQQ